MLSTKFDAYLKFKQINPLKESSLKVDNIIENDIVPHPLPLIPKDYFLLVYGYGAGHGVGMSQWGAKAMAERGSNFRKILKHYYTGVQIKTY